MKQSQSGFTLIELLIVIAIAAVLATAVVVILNPAVILKQARDGTRIADLESIATAVKIAKFEGVYLGTSSIAYLSLPDNASSTCGSYSLPTLPSGWSYHCVTEANFTKNDGTGWIPINFAAIGTLAFGNLPVDPVNQATSSLYYVYVAGDSEDSAAPELVAPSEGGAGSRTAPAATGRCPGVFRISAIPRVLCGVPNSILVSFGGGNGVPGSPVLHLESDTGVYAATDGTGAAPADAERVGSWRDQSSNAYLFARGASLGPGYQTNESNGKPAIDFAAASDTKITKTGVTDLLTGGQRAFTAALVLAGPSTGGAANNGAWVAQNEGGGVQDKWIIHNGVIASTNNFSMHLQGSGGEGNINGATPVGDPAEINIIRRQTDGTWIIRKAGAQVASGTTSIAFGTPNTGDIEIGYTEGGNNLSGEIFAIILYATALSDADILTLETYLGKYIP